MARSAELTAASALLVAAALLSVWGDDLFSRLVRVVRTPWLGDLGVPGEGESAVDLVARVQETLVQVAFPTLGILGGSVLAAILAHQAQVGGLFAPGLLAPDPSRLWSLNLDDEGGGEGLLGRSSRGLWSMVKAVVVVGVAALVIRTHLDDFAHLGRADVQGMALAAGGLVRSTALILALATTVLGLIDYALQRNRFEAMLRTTDDEHREDLRSADGDPALRVRRRNLAKSLRGDAPELLRGASLTLLGPSDLVIVLAGGPPPRKVTIRSSAHGPAGQKLRKAALAANLTLVEAPDLARTLAQLRTPNIPPEILPTLLEAWPEV